MAKASTPNSAGSQFFIVYKDTTLPRNYEIWGHVTEGLDRVTAIAGAGTDNANGAGDGHPNQPVVIVTATVSKK
jgi:peptidyl-prolyl cis-trans isomerase B (cyclophilin B)